MILRIAEVNRQIEVHVPDRVDRIGIRGIAVRAIVGVEVVRIEAIQGAVHHEIVVLVHDHTAAPHRPHQVVRIVEAIVVIVVIQMIPNEAAISIATK